MKDYGRAIEVYDKFSDKFITEFPLIISTKKLITIVKGNNDDPEVTRDTYPLAEQQVRDLGVAEALEVNNGAGEYSFYLVNNFYMDLNKNNIREYALKSLNDVRSFAKFVHYAEFLYQDDELFPTQEEKESYIGSWIWLEAVNAGALSHWENDGFPPPMTWQLWEIEYKAEATEVVEFFLKIFNFNYLN